MSGIFNAQRAAFCGLVLAGVQPYVATAVVKSSRKTLLEYVGPDWFEGWAVSPLRRKRPSERAQAIVDHFRGAHRTMQETASAFGVTREYVRQVLVRAGVNDRTYGATPREAKEDALAVYRKAISEGHSASAAVVVAGHPHKVLSNWAADLGQTLPRPRSLRRERWAEIARFYQENPALNQRQVAERFATRQTEVSHALKAHGVSSRWWKSPETAARSHAPRPPSSNLLRAT
ncbi:MAG: sigma factor-like helix-turn-helix DNA-binding protein [Acidobacteriota bacterium]